MLWRGLTNHSFAGTVVFDLAYYNRAFFTCSNATRHYTAPWRSTCVTSTFDLAL